ncbi:DNase I-like protein, partial [Clavulina sp. PMI_390]
MADQPNPAPGETAQDIEALTDARTDIKPTHSDQNVDGCTETNNPLRLRGGANNSSPKRRTPAGLGIASLNIRGAGSNDKRSKWAQALSLFHRKKISIAVIQETHSKDKLIKELNRDYPAWELHHTAGVGRRQAEGGVVLAVNREKLPLKGTRTRVIIPGHALWASIPWRKGIRIKILAVHAPNPADKNAAFWREIWAALRNPGNGNITPVDFIMGDFNMVENQQDRWPQREDPAQAESFQELKEAYSLQDGWRRFWPDPERQASFFQTADQGGSMSRIDRIYCTDKMYRRATEWEISDTYIPKLDHHMVSTRLIDYKEPAQGPGRWALAISLLSDREFLTTIETIGRELEEEMELAERDRSTDYNPQKVFCKFPKRIEKAARKRSGVKTGRIMTQIKKLEEDLS